MVVYKKHGARAVMISLFVGTLLNLINQGEVIFAADWDSLNLTKVLLTYLVPFVVSLYTAVKVHRSQ